MISNIVSSILNPVAIAANADRATQLQTERDTDRPVVSTALAAKAVASGLTRQAVEQSNKSDEIDYFHTAKNLIRAALKDFSHGVEDSLGVLGFGDGMAGKLTKAVMAQTKDALLWGVGFSVKLMTATVTQTSSSSAPGALPTFSVMARSVEIKVNHSNGVIDVDSEKVTIESQYSGGPGTPEPRLLDISDTDAVPTSNLATALQALGDPKALETMDKVYTTGARGVGAANRYIADGVRFLNRQLVSPERPMALEPGKAATIELRVGQHVRAKEPQGIGPSVQLRLRVKNLADAGDLSVKLNDELLSGGTKSGDWLEYSVSPPLVAKGMNRFELTLKPDTAAKPTVEDLLLWVRYKK